MDVHRDEPATKKDLDLVRKDLDHFIRVRSLTIQKGLQFLRLFLTHLNLSPVFHDFLQVFNPYPSVSSLYTEAELMSNTEDWWNP